MAVSVMTVEIHAEPAERVERDGHQSCRAGTKQAQPSEAERDVLLEATPLLTAMPMSMGRRRVWGVEGGAKVYDTVSAW